MGKKTYGGKINWRISLPEDLALKIEIAMYDPKTGKPDYGAKSQLITMLLTAYLEEQERLQNVG